MALAQLEFETIRAHRTARPFLKWAGGKSSLLPILSKFVPKEFRNYVEPFVGGGALFFSTQPESGILGDANAELISCYEAVRDEPGGGEGGDAEGWNSIPSVIIITI